MIDSNTLRQIKIAVVIAIAIAFFTISTTVVSLYTDWLWFTEVGYLSVFKKVIFTTWGLGLAGGAAFFVFLFLNVTAARRLAPRYRVVFEEPSLERIRQIFTQFGRWAVFAVSLAISIIAAFSTSGAWEKFLLFYNSVLFKLKDPVFGIDTGFYVFKLPFLQFLYGWIMALLVITFILIAAVHWLEGSIRITSNMQRFTPQVKAHLSLIASLIFVNLAWGYRLKMFELLYSSRGAAYGANYTDVNANLPVLWVLLGVALVSAVIVLVNVRLKGWKLPALSLALLMGTSVVGGGIYPAIVQQYKVKPNEIKLESPFIKRNIDFTRKAYGIDKVEKVDFNIVNDLTIADVRARKSTVENIRLWDWRPLKDTYQQLQSIRPYYKFNDVDIDRYVINGRKRQVAIAARELGDLPDDTWLNRHLVFTHGYGVVMNQANEVTSEGLPKLIIKNLPPVSETDIKVTRPEIYYGENLDNYAIVNSTEKELDYPKGDKNVYTRYRGKGGIAMGSAFRRLLFAYSFSDVNILLTNAVNKDSRLMFNRNIVQRTEKIAPFLYLDEDPYIVVGDNGRLFWMHDAYTVSSRFPYSEPSAEGYNYIRNSVKVVTDAYNGRITLYDMGGDPVLKAYNKIFPGLTKPFKAMPEDLKNHVRYPEKLFKVQSEKYMTYHMQDPKVFYNKEDKWNMPKEKYSNSQQQIEPYYAILELAKARGDFLMITPFTPANKNNMISWLSANSEPDKYGQLLAFKFPKQELVYGPLQIEARVDQDPLISESFTLWGQIGSNVIRGNLLVIPIKNSLIYVEPVYLQSSESQIPELKRVIVAYKDRVVMEPTFEAALEAVFSGQTADSQVRETTSKEDNTKGTLISQAKEAFQEAMRKQKEGDWGGYGKAIDKLGKLLEQIK